LRPIALPFGVDGQRKRIAFDISVGDFVQRKVATWPYFHDKVKIGSTWNDWTIEYPITLSNKIFQYSWPELFGQTGYSVQNSTAIGVPYIGVANGLNRSITRFDYEFFDAECETAVIIVMGSYQENVVDELVAIVIAEFDNMFATECGRNTKSCMFKQTAPDMKSVAMEDYTSTRQTEYHNGLHLVKFDFIIKTKLVLYDLDSI